LFIPTEKKRSGGISGSIAPPKFLSLQRGSYSREQSGCDYLTAGLSMSYNYRSSRLGKNQVNTLAQKVTLPHVKDRPTNY
jgi:hypothetical protein